MNIKSVAVIGLGYVGLPLAVHLARAGFEVTGVDTDEQLIHDLRIGKSVNPDLPVTVFPLPKNMLVCTEPLLGADAYIICVPTPDIDGKRMDPAYVLEACRAVGRAAKDDAIVVIESTVTPGSTNTIFRDAVSATKGDSNFHMAFSPERVNPGSSYFHEMGNDEKLVGVGDEARKALSVMYGKVFSSVVTVGIEEAELAKTFENAQRDLNISLMNELAMNCLLNDINYPEVIRGLRTKSTSPVFISGMVGGHCISVDPYFLGEYYQDDDCLAMHGRRTNENYIEFVGGIVIGNTEPDDEILIIGRSYKPGVTDSRNSGGVKLRNYLVSQGATEVFIHDPLTDSSYSWKKPALVVGAVNHDPMLDIAQYYGLDEDTIFVNIGGGFTVTQTMPFNTVIEL